MAHLEHFTRLLPGHISNDAINSLLDSLGLPKASKIYKPDVTAYLHTIYMIDLPQNKTGYTSLVLRASGNHLPRIKTGNEVGVMAWVAKNTTIPIPAVVAFDDSCDNPIGYEYTLLSKVEGKTFSDVYKQLSEEQFGHFLNQLIDILDQLHAHDFSQIGGLYIGKDGDINVGQVIDEKFIMAGEIGTLWPADETVASLNIAGPYDTYVDYITATVKNYIKLIGIHDNLAQMRETISRLEKFLEALPPLSQELNNVKLRVAHKDLHFANILFDLTTNKITSILDWEFSGVQPMPRWDPVKAFLWNMRDDNESRAEKQKAMARFTNMCKERGVHALDDAKYASPLQESMQLIAVYLMAIVTTAAHGEGAENSEKIPQWKASMLELIGHFEQKV